MILKKLEEIILFSLGKNPTRLKGIDNNLYAPNDFEDDLQGVNDTSDTNFCIINLIKTKAAPLSILNKEKCFTSNYIICEMDSKVLDPWYLCYEFNEGKSFEQQISMYHQGTTLSVKKLSIKSIGELKIKLIDIKKQRQIGEIYRKLIIQKRLMQKQIENYNNFTLQIIGKIEED